METRRQGDRQTWRRGVEEMRRGSTSRFIRSPCLLVSLSPCLLLPPSALSAVPRPRATAPADQPDPVPLRRVWLTPDGWRGRWNAPGRACWSSCRATSSRTWCGGRPRRRRRGRTRRGWSRRRYHAQLADGGLAGSCEWKVVHTAAGPGLLPLTPLNLALHAPSLTPLNPAPGQPSGSRDAAIGDFDGHDPSLLIDAPGRILGVGRLVGPRRGAAGGAAIRPAISGLPGGRA